ncbi:expressed unknown protein [Seminavis robusta]|uniref:Uncharacterized protein n=1 Tax=Seminavis robusta TaxID=568900 RepID=A0A9N8I0W0_9STRA|nr:expressed unknown protein [Seminavis robusta]|eukprot:Sro2908_g340061.1  (141) ;mRNA; f:5409-5831
MLSRAASTIGRTSVRRMRRGPSTTTTAVVQRRTMGGGGAAMEGSPAMMGTAAEVFGVICWLWVFSRAREDLPWILGFRHPWDHVEDPFAPHDSHGHGSASKEETIASWDKFNARSIKPGEDDDDDDDEDEDDDDDDDDDE